MDDFQSYLDLYAPGAATMRAALEGRIAPSSHYEAYFNVPFPELRTGLNGLGDVGQPLGRPRAATLSVHQNTDFNMVAPPAVWLQRAINASIATGRSPVLGTTPLAVDGVAGTATLGKVLDAYRGARARGLLSGSREPYLTNVAVDGGTVRTVAMPRALLMELIDANLMQVADPTGSVCSAVSNEICTRASTPGTPDPGTPNTPPTPASSSGTLIAAVAAAVLLGLWAARS